MMRAEPAKWKPKRRSRTSQVAYSDNDLLPRVRRLEIELRELIQQLVAQKVYEPPKKKTRKKSVLINAPFEGPVPPLSLSLP